MKKVGNILFWIIITVLLVVIAYNLYNRYKPNIDLKQIPQQESRRDEGEAADNDGQQDRTGGDGQVERPQEQQPGEQGSDEQKPQKIIAPDFTLEDLQGNKIKLSDYRGKIVFLNFWATWCPYCVREMPDLEAAHIELSKVGNAAILTINVQEDLEKVKEFVEENGLTLPVLMDYDGMTAGLYGVSSFPTTLVVDADGTAYGYHTGPLTKTQILNLVDRIKGE